MRKLIFEDEVKFEGTVDLKMLFEMFTEVKLKPTAQGFVKKTSDKGNKKVLNILNKLLKERMAKGETIIVKGTEYFDEIYPEIKKALETTRYQVYLKDSDKKYAKRIGRFSKIEDVLKLTWFDFSEYEKIHHIGDIHACATVLKEYLGEMNPNHLYIFTGDYMERGIEHKETLELIMQLVDLPNVIMLEGNHEKYLNQYASDEHIQYTYFRETYAKILDGFDLDKKEIRKFYRKLRKFVAYSYGDKKVFVSHGGLTEVPEMIGLVPEYQIIRGVGGYDVDVDRIFTENHKDDDVYLIHGHRNQFENPVQVGKAFNLEGSIEYGYHLRAVSLDKDGFESHEVLNNVYDVTLNSDKITKNTSIKTVLEMLRENELVNEKETVKGVSSFNFNKKVFFDSIWNSQTVKSRGLHIATDVEEPYIVARSFEKFFNIGEYDLE